MSAFPFALGDVVRFNRGQYSHLALYAGGGRVVHLWSPSERDFQVRVDSIRFVQRNTSTSQSPEPFSVELDAKMLQDQGLSPLEGEEVVRRAMTRLGEAHYDCLAFNCEHFVTWARYGFGASPQVTSNANQVLAGAMVGAMVGGMAGFVVGGLISLFTKADALSASAGVGPSASAAAATSTELSSEEDGDTEEEEQQQDTEEQMRRSAREMLWNGLPEACAPAAMDAMTQMEDWAESRRRRSAAASSRKYTDERHETLANRLAEDDLQCR
ncbi:retinoic acid receptor responder (tazarotene induced) 3 [Phytophthora boehmeriae]|uniref:phospholipase A2 n=1 Tax=Phytophthora boehmeriae TaxID=109152 RepID=A0A8T1X3Z3_9STRA|nr:retinoic acid receptor responder (tazarotene induced) 3 [Phytophthora boehmeriae]